MLNGCSFLATRKSLKPVTNEPDEFKLKTHSNIDKFTPNVLALAVVVIRARFSFFLCSEMTKRLPNLMREITEIIVLTNRNFLLIIFDNLQALFKVVLVLRSEAL